MKTRLLALGIALGLMAAIVATAQARAPKSAVVTLRKTSLGTILVLASLGAIGIALGTLVSLMVSEYTPLFGFMESGYRLAIVLTLLFDVLTTVFLTVYLLMLHGRSKGRP